MAIYSPKKPKEIRGVSLCAGVGGLDLGIHLAEPNYRTVCYVERNSFAAASLVARMADASLDQAPIWDDLKSFDGKPWRRKVHLVSAGYPCQPFTLSGVRQGNKDPRHLWPEVARIVSEIQPEVVFFENVPGHLSLGFRDVCSDLQSMGFTIAARVVSAAEVGGSHTRERLFILGYANGQKQWKSGLHPVERTRDKFQNRSQSNGFTSGNIEPSSVLDVALGHSKCRGMERDQVCFFPPKPDDILEWRETLRKCPKA